MSTQETLLDEVALPYPFCPGCGHGLILDHLNAALVNLGLDPHQVVIVTDIGCSGLSDQYFVTNAFHGLHGRSVTYASGMKLANPDLKVIVLMGDGGCGIGGHHLINAARRNIGVTVLVFNNFNFGMTGGQHSVTTPHGAITTTTRGGNLEWPLDICATVQVNGASFVARKTVFDKDLSQVIAQAIANEGFSLIDIWELCTAYFVPSNRFSRKALQATLERLGYQTGVLHWEKRDEYSQAYRAAYASQRGQPAMAFQLLEPGYVNHLTTKVHCVLAGSAGGKVRSTARALGQGAVLSGLWATQRDDYPVTVMSGYSVSEVVMSPQEIHYTSIPEPDFMVVLSREGLAKVRHHLARMTVDDRLYVNSALLPIETNARTIALDFELATIRASKRNMTLLGVAAALRHAGFYPLEAFQEAISLGRNPEIVKENLAIVDASAGMISGC
jgi:pyruvate/2-oxoacid:ferredoxin oxidoreductase beta subunit/Pyruvate/2-oxoacid:ferredoxin oxidoreductase gamma subunit